MNGDETPQTGGNVQIIIYGIDQNIKREVSRRLFDCEQQATDPLAQAQWEHYIAAKQLH